MAATNFIRVNKFAPFFLYLAYTIPHANNGLKDHGMEVPSDAPYSNQPWPQPEKNKAAMITRLDADVGRILAMLKALNLDSNTVIFFSSDNGPHKEGGVNPAFFQSAGPLRGIKRDLYEGGIRVPMIVRWPGKIPPGTVSDQVWHFADFLPTAAEIAGAQVPPDLDGISILPTLLGQKQTRQHPYLYWEFHEGGSKQAVRLGDWKGVRLEPGQPLELYNLKTDPAETTNVADAHPDVVAQIEAILKTARTESDLSPLRTAAEARKARQAQTEKTAPNANTRTGTP
jgi:arylsulfatase A-like enzyme